MSEGCILVVDDDPQIQRMLSGLLAMRGYDVRVAGCGADALRLAVDAEPHLVLLDIRMPGMCGLEVCRQLRVWSAVPVILLTVNDSPESKIDALDLGADDYLTKPFHMGELLARIRSLLRRAHGKGGQSPGALTIGDLTIDLARHYVRRGDTELRFTRIEFALLREFVIHADRILPYTHLLEAAWGPGCEEDTHLLHVHVGNLRRKLNPDPTISRLILATPGVGYRLRTRG